MSSLKKISYIVMASLCIMFFLLSSTNLIIKEETQEIKEISVIVPDKENGYLEYFKRGIQEAANEDRADVNNIAYQQGSADELIELLEREYESGAGAAILVLEEENLRVKEYLEEKSGAFPIITINSFSTAIRGTTNITFTAKDAAKYLAEKIEQEQGKDTGIVFLTARGSVSKEVYKLFRKEFEPYKWNIEEWDLSIQSAEAYLKHSRGKKIYIGCWMDVTEEVLESMGGENLYGIGYTNQIFNAMRENKVGGVVAFSMYSMGVYAVQKAVSAIGLGSSQETVQVPYRFITEENLKEEQKFLFPMY